MSFFELAEAFGDRAFGALMFVFALPNLVPLPPGLSSVFGVPLIVIAAQLAAGRSSLWLPRLVEQKSIDRRTYQRLVGYCLPTLQHTERLLEPRLHFMFGGLGDRLIGFACLTLATILFLPIPLGNMLPAFAIAVFSLALIYRDGIAALVGWAATLGSVAIIALVSGAILAAAKSLLETVHSTLGA